MIPEITKRLAESYYKIRGDDISGNDKSDWMFAEDVIRRVLCGDEPLGKYEWLLSVEDYEWLKNEIRLIHGRCYIIHHDVVHYCAKIGEELDQGNIRKAQELLEKMARSSQTGMIVEMRHGA